MKEKIYNYNNIKEEEINDRIIRVKAIMLNSKNEILLGEAFGTVQYPGGHKEGLENLSEALVREIREETGIILKGEFKPFFAIKYFLKDYPVVGNNRSTEIYYFYIFTDEVYNLSNTNFDDEERSGDFKLLYVPLKEFKKVLKSYENKQDINKLINREMLLSMKILKKEGIYNGRKKI